MFCCLKNLSKNNTFFSIEIFLLCVLISHWMATFQWDICDFSAGLCFTGRARNVGQQRRYDGWWWPGWQDKAHHVRIWLAGWEVQLWVFENFQKNSCTFALPYVWDFVVLAPAIQRRSWDRLVTQGQGMKEWSLVNVWPLLPTIYILEHYLLQSHYYTCCSFVQTVVLFWPSGPPLKDALHICRHVCILDLCVCVAHHTSCVVVTRIACCCPSKLLHWSRGDGMALWCRCRYPRHLYWGPGQRLARIHSGLSTARKGLSSAPKDPIYPDSTGMCVSLAWQCS